MLHATPLCYGGEAAKTFFRTAAYESTIVLTAPIATGFYTCVKGIFIEE